MPIMIFMTSYYPDKRQYTRTTAVLRLKYLLILFLLIPAGIFFSSCEEKTTIIGIGILPPGDFTSTRSTDTISVFSYTYSVDSVKSALKTYSYLGGLYDPYFGTSTTGFVGQLRILKKFESVNPITKIDSVKLLMSISGAKGVLKTRQEIIIYEVDELLNPDSTYYSNRDPHATNLMADTLMPVIQKDSAQGLIVKLPVSFGEHLMRDPSKLYQDTLENDFRSFFNGIYCQMVPYTGTKGFSRGFYKGSGTDSLQLIALTFDQSDFIIRVYYSTAATTSSLYYDFTINPNSARYNLYSHDFAFAEPGKEIKHVDDNVKDTLSYLQGFNGVYTKIKIPALDSLKKLGRVSVNKARLTIPVFLDGNIYTATTMPTKIFLSYKAKDGIRYVVPDYQVNPAFFDGSYNATSKKYTFNLASFTQMYLDDTAKVNKKIPLPELDLYFQEGEYKNVILKANNAVSKLRFEFTYTRF
jgi:hypothetical protein